MKPFDNKVYLYFAAILLLLSISGCGSSKKDTPSIDAQVGKGNTETPLTTNIENKLQTIIDNQALIIKNNDDIKSTTQKLIGQSSVASIQPDSSKPMKNGEGTSQLQDIPVKSPAETAIPADDTTRTTTTENDDNANPSESSAENTTADKETIEPTPPKTSNLSPYLTSALNKLTLPSEVTVDRFDTRLETSIDRNITGKYSIPLIDITEFSTEQIENTINTFVKKDLVIEVDPPPFDVENLRQSAKSFFTISPDPEDNPDYLVDGDTDEEEIQTALKLVWEAGGGMVFLYPGTYYINSQLAVWDHVTLKGSGRVGDRATIIQLMDYSESLAGKAGIIRMKKDFVKGNQEKRVYHATIEDFIVDGNKEHQTHGISDSEKKYGYYGEGDYITIRRITNRNCMGYGFDPHATMDTRPSKYMLIEDSYALNNYKDGFTLDMVQEARFVNNVAEYNARHGFNVITHAREIMIANNVSRYNQGAGLKMQNGAHSITYINNHFYENDQEGIYLRSSNNNTFVNNYIFNNKRNGIRLTGTTHTIFENNVIAFNANSGARYPEILIQAYDGSYELWPEKASSLANEIKGNIIISSYPIDLFVETDDSNWNRIYDNNIWRANQEIILIGKDSLKMNNTLNDVGETSENKETEK